MNIYHSISSNTRIRLLVILSIFVFTIESGCKKFIEVPAPDTSVNQENVFTINSNAISVLTGVLAKMSNTNFSLGISVNTELSADNLTLFDLNNAPALLYYRNALNPKYENDYSILWYDLYSNIYVTNAAIDGLSKSTSLSEIVKKRLLGEAYFLRAFFYFYLTNLYGNVPLVVTTDYTVSGVLGNSIIEKNLDQMILDLRQARGLLDPTYVDGTILKTTLDRVRPNSLSASAMLSRVYLYSKNYIQAEKEATMVIDKSDLYTLTDLSKVFLKNSSETIWALQPVSYNINTWEGNFYIYSAEGPNSINYTYLSNSFMNSFEAGDLRKINWVGIFNVSGIQYNYPFKYKVQYGDPAAATENLVVLRLAEQYLIRAEARIQQGNIKEGIEDLNFIRKRARANSDVNLPNPLPDLPTNLPKELALKAVLKERRVELFTEWGNRWFDLRRTGSMDTVMTKESIAKGASWQSYQQIYPIPLQEILLNPKLIQSAGYK